MPGSNKHHEYLRKAQEAEEAQALVTDPEAKDSWERIIVGYLELADLAKRRGD